MGYHPYTYPAMPTDDPGDGPFVSVTPKLHDLMAKHGDRNKQIWGTEIGAPTIPGTSPRFVAEYVTKAYRQWDRWKFTGPLIWFSYLDAGTNPTEGEDNLGLVRADFILEGARAHRVREGHAPAVSIQLAGRSIEDDRSDERTRPCSRTRRHTAASPSTTSTQAREFYGDTLGLEDVGGARPADAAPRRRPADARLPEAGPHARRRTRS